MQASPGDPVGFSKQWVLLSLILTLFIGLTTSSLFPLAEWNYMLFIFHSHVLTPASTSSHPVVPITSSLYRLNRPDNTALPHTFLDWEPFCYVLFKFHFAFLLCVHVLYYYYQTYEDTHISHVVPNLEMLHSIKSVRVTNATPTFLWHSVLCTTHLTLTIRSPPPYAPRIKLVPLHVTFYISLQLFLNNSP
jgi:hypothetical protein